MKTNKSLHYVASAAVLLLLGTGHLHAQMLYDFNTTTQLAGDFNASSGSGYGTLTNVATGGLSNSGSLSVPAPFADSFAYTTKAAFSATQPSFGISTYFRAQPGTLGGVALALTIGAVDETTGLEFSPVGIPTAATANSLVLTLRNRGTANSDGLSFELNTFNNAATLTGEVSAPVVLTDGNWYQLSAAYIYNGSNSFTLTGQIFNSDSSGTLGSALYGTAPSWTRTNAGLADGDFFGLLSSQNGARRGIAQLDNYAVVPEPSSIALLVAGLLAFTVVRRRRQKRLAA